MHITCPKCRRTLNCPEAYAGRRISCGACHIAFGVPAGGGGVAVAVRPAVRASRPRASRYLRRGSGLDAGARLQRMRASIAEFWEETHRAWLAGRLLAIIPQSADIAGQTTAEALRMEFSSKEFECLHYILRKFGPLAGEFFCGGAKECALTNYRLGQRDGVTRRHFVMPLGMLTGQIDETGWWTKTATYHFASGRALTLSKMGAFIPEKNVRVARDWGDYAGLDNGMQLLIGNIGRARA